MAPSPYLLHVNSRPTAVDDTLWTKWYTFEHIPDLVGYGASTRAGFYQEVTMQSDVSEPSSNPRKFLALYQSKHEEPLKSDGYKDKVRKTSELFKEATGMEKNQDNGEFDARNYNLIQNYDPKDLGDATSPFILTVEMQPPDPTDFDKWYKEEHLEMLTKIPGYRKSSRYVIGPPTPLTMGEPARYLAIHELESLDGTAGPEAQAANETEWTKRMLRDSSIFIARPWKLVKGEEGADNK